MYPKNQKKQNNQNKQSEKEISQDKLKEVQAQQFLIDLLRPAIIEFNRIADPAEIRYILTRGELWSRIKGEKWEKTPMTRKEALIKINQITGEIKQEIKNQKLHPKAEIKDKNGPRPKNEKVKNAYKQLTRKPPESQVQAEWDRMQEIKRMEAKNIERMEELLKFEDQNVYKTEEYQKGIHLDEELAQNLSPELKKVYLDANDDTLPEREDVVEKKSSIDNKFREETIFSLPKTSGNRHFNRKRDTKRARQYINNFTNSTHLEKVEVNAQAAAKAIKTSERLFAEELSLADQIIQRRSYEIDNYQAWNNEIYNQTIFPQWYITYYIEDLEKQVHSPEAKKLIEELESQTTGLERISYDQEYLWEELQFGLHSGWNSERLNPQFAPPKFIDGQQDPIEKVPLALEFLRRAGIRFMIYPITDFQAQQPESKYSYDEWLEWLKGEFLETAWGDLFNHAAEISESIRQELFEEEERSEKARQQKILADRYRRVEQMKRAIQSMVDDYTRHKQMENAIKQFNALKKQYLILEQEYKALLNAERLADYENLARKERFRDHYRQARSIEKYSHLVETGVLPKLKIALNKAKEMPFPGQTRSSTMLKYKLDEIREYLPWIIAGAMIFAAFVPVYHQIDCVNDPAVINLWRKFGQNDYKYTAVDNNKRLITMDFAPAGKAGLKRVMNLWKKAIDNKGGAEEFYTRCFGDKSDPTLKDSTMGDLIQSPQVATALGFFIPDISLTIKGIKIKRSYEKKGFLSEKFFDNPDLEYEEFDVTDMPIEEAWHKFQNKEYILLIQNPTTLIEDNRRFKLRIQDFGKMAEKMAKDHRGLYVTRMPYTPIEKFPGAVKKLYKEIQSYNKKIKRGISLAKFFKSKKIRNLFNLPENRTFKVAIHDKVSLKRLGFMDTITEDVMEGHTVKDLSSYLDSYYIVHIYDPESYSVKKIVELILKIKKNFEDVYYACFDIRAKLKEDINKFIPLDPNEREEDGFKTNKSEYFINETMVEEIINKFLENNNNQSNLVVQYLKEIKKIAKVLIEFRNIKKKADIFKNLQETFDKKSVSYKKIEEFQQKNAKSQTRFAKNMYSKALDTIINIILHAPYDKHEKPLKYAKIIADAPPIYLHNVSIHDLGELLNNINERELSEAIITCNSNHFPYYSTDCQEIWTAVVNTEDITKTKEKIPSIVLKYEKKKDTIEKEKKGIYSLRQNIYAIEANKVNQEDQTELKSLEINLKEKISKLQKLCNDFYEFKKILVDIVSLLPETAFENIKKEKKEAIVQKIPPKALRLVPPQELIQKIYTRTLPPPEQGRIWNEWNKLPVALRDALYWNYMHPEKKTKSYTCRYCNLSGSDIEVHHIWPYEPPTFAEEQKTHMKKYQLGLLMVDDFLEKRNGYRPYRTFRGPEEPWNLVALCRDHGKDGENGEFLIHHLVPSNMSGKKDENLLLDNTAFKKTIAFNDGIIIKSIESTSELLESADYEVVNFLLFNQLLKFNHLTLKSLMGEENEGVELEELHQKFLTLNDIDNLSIMETKYDDKKYEISEEKFKNIQKELMKLGDMKTMKKMIKESFYYPF
jgi:hypothetical protein